MTILLELSGSSGHLSLQMKFKQWGIKISMAFEKKKFI